MNRSGLKFRTDTAFVFIGILLFTYNEEDPTYQSKAAADVKSYTMHIGLDDGFVDCFLTNVVPTMKGPGNTVNVSCLAPAGCGVRRPQSSA